MQFARLDIDLFLREYWQKKPLLIRNPWKQWRNPIDPDDLAGLACEDEIESRLITRTGDTGGPVWTLEQGPFAAERFGRTDGQPWTLLVQAVDHVVPDVAALIAPFRFIPDWRIDDVMVSYASDKGGVGPHFDQYDVFLVQGLGKRRWQVGPLCDATTALLPHDDLRLLASFDATDEWMLEPGDMLYVPPGVAHDGVAVGDDCMTYSIGFRAPSRSDLIEGWCNHLLGGLEDDDRYQDGFDALDAGGQDHPGEISPTALTRLHQMVTEKMLDGDAFARWFGHYISAPKYPDMDFRPDDDPSIDGIRAFLADGVPLCRNPASRFSYIRGRAGSLSLFVDGHCFDCDNDTAAFARQLCAQDRMTFDPALSPSPGVVLLIEALVKQGSVAFDREED